MRQAVAAVGWGLICAWIAACGLSSVGSGPGANDGGPRDSTVGGDMIPPPQDGASVDGMTVDVGGDGPASDGMGSTSDGAVDTGVDVSADAGADVGIDAGVDSGVDAGVDTGIDSGIDTGVDTGVDAGILYVCGSQMVSDCSTCSGNPLGCVMCATMGQGIYAVCVPFYSSCWQSYRPTGYDWCYCTTPADCIVPQQECNPYNGGVCVTCGENQTQGYGCKSGGNCNETTGVCQ